MKLLSLKKFYFSTISYVIYTYETQTLIGVRRTCMDYQSETLSHTSYTSTVTLAVASWISSSLNGNSWFVL